MDACIRWLVAVLVNTLCIWPVPAAAQTQTHSTSGPFITAEQARDAFTTAGYMADPIIDWASAALSLRTLLRTFEVHDQATQRVVMVLVFPSVEAVGLPGVFRGTLAMNGELDRPEPLLVADYGPRVWRRNVAMVESTESKLARVAQLQVDQDTAIYPDPRAAELPVDLDFQQALNNSDVNI